MTASRYEDDRATEPRSEERRDASVMICTWIFGGTASLLLGGVVALLFLLPVNAVLVKHGAAPDTVMLVSGLLMGAGCGAALGLAQWAALHGQVPGVGRWWLCTIAGWSLGAGLGGWGGLHLAAFGAARWGAWVSEGMWLEAGATLCLGALGASVAQWSLLRERVRGAWIWIVANALSWTGGYLAMRASFVGMRDDLVAEPMMTVAYGFGAALLGLLTGGCVLVFLLPRYRAPETLPRARVARMRGRRARVR
ncbi:hypothetical protein [Haliangium ochraceum]|uniref:Uncharacterized protein n=1 Tax=Haliangium ochraceum (strain DSM 14365 / JCM 11303 / SMP-2) TaxID=502025 RepID=D0LZG2_HALO1|nr:hypothetical protein [Haliangium ochraceum]ACY17941.1 hypothetical protein Hoch_5458 [Haliangium ochraceum DSM 14365]